MKYAVLISTQREPGLLADLTGDLFSRGIFPEQFGSETMGTGTVRIRLALECDEKTIAALVVFWEKILQVQSVVVTPALRRGEPPAPDEPLFRSGEPLSA
jgi:hypothetical protein